MNDKKNLPARLSGKDEGSFAFLTIRDRMPIILTKAIDIVHRHAGKLLQDEGESTSRDCSSIVARLSELKSEMMTNKPLRHIIDSGDDVAEWNRLVDHVKTTTGTDPKWFTTSWLFSECYMYRRIKEAITLSSQLKTLDPFENQKQEAFHASREAMLASAQEFDALIKANNKADESSFRNDFELVLKHSLWGNKTDLSLLATRAESQDLGKLQVSSRAALLSLNSKILVDDTDAVFASLLRSARRRVDIVLDNAGFELFNDLCLADWLLQSGLTRSVHLHLKAMPWFVSDTLKRDFHWLLDRLTSSNDTCLVGLGQRWRSRLESNEWVLIEHKFWTLPYEFAHMKDLAPDLYSNLSNSDLIFFKGDLNYRKLLADRHWPHDTPFGESLGGFQPAPLCALRSLKAELVSGLGPGQAESLYEQAKDWLFSGQYAVIQLSA